MELLKSVFIFIKEWSDVLLILVGLSAFIIYFWQKRDKKRSAATMILGQIDSIEEKIGNLKADHQLNNIAIYHSKSIIGENTWENYKHLFAKELSASEYKKVQNFFDTAEQIEKMRVDIIKTINNAWADKSSVEHEIIGEMIKNDVLNKPDVSSAEQIGAFRRLFSPLDIVFTPDVAIEGLNRNLNNFEVISGTTAYKTIQKYSFSK